MSFSTENNNKNDNNIKPIKEKQTVIISPKSNVVDVNTDSIYKITQTQIHSKKVKAKIVNIKKNRKNVAIIRDIKDEANNVINNLSNLGIIKEKTNIYIPKKPHPIIVIKNISNFYDDTNINDNLVI